MIKINFKNGASGKTPLNATNLNKMQDNIEEATMINRIILQGNSIQEGTPSIDSEAPIESVGDNINLFDKNNIIEKHRLGSDGENYSDTKYFISDYIEIKENIECVKNTPIGVYQAVSYYDKDKKHIARNTTENPFTTPKGTCYIRTCDLLTNLDTLKLEKGLKATPYSPYGQGSIEIALGDGTTSQTKAIYTQQPFRAIGYEKDRFVKQNGVWYEEHNIEKVVLDKTQEIKKGTASEQINTIYLTMQYANSILSTRDINCMCENLQSYSGSFMWANDVEGIGQSSSQIVFRISKEKVTTLEEAKTFIENNPITVHVKRAEPLLIPCTTEQVEILNDIYSTYGKGLTNITCTDEVAPVIEIVKESKETVQSENDKAISSLLARIEELEKKVQ